MNPLGSLFATEGGDLHEANYSAPDEICESMADLAAVAVDAVALAASQAGASAKLAVKQEAEAAAELVALAVISAAEIADRAAAVAANEAKAAVEITAELAIRSAKDVASSISQAINTVKQVAETALAKALDDIALVFVRASEGTERAGVAAATEALAAVGTAAELALRSANKASANIEYAVADAKRVVAQNAANAAQAVALAVQRAAEVAEENAARAAKLTTVEMAAAISQLRISEGKREQAEERRAALEVQLRESQKMEALGILAGGIAHDFNNIIATIIGNTALAKKDVQVSPDDALVSLEEIDKAAKRAKNLVQQILVFSRKGAQTFVVQPVRPLVEEAIRLLRSTTPAGVELAAELTNAPLYAGVDATQIAQVLINLCANASHAMKDSAGRIEIGMAEVLLDQTAAQVSPDLHPGRYVRLSVRDNGSGMDEATQAHIFEPFFTTKGVGAGTGLGLSVVHGIVKAHGGAITLESASGKGATFLVYLPAVAAPA